MIGFYAKSSCVKGRKYMYPTRTSFPIFWIRFIHIMADSPSLSNSEYTFVSLGNKPNQFLFTFQCMVHCMWQHSFHTLMVWCNSVWGSVCGASFAKTARVVITPSHNHLWNSAGFFFGGCAESMYVPNSRLAPWWVTSLSGSAPVPQRQELISRISELYMQRAADHFVNLSAIFYIVSTL